MRSPNASQSSAFYAQKSNLTAPPSIPHGFPYASFVCLFIHIHSSIHSAVPAHAAKKHKETTVRYTNARPLERWHVNRVTVEFLRLGELRWEIKL